MTLFRHGFRSGVTAYILQSGYSAIHIIFVVWVVFVKAIFSCLNLQPDDGFLSCNMPELFNKTGRSLTDTAIT